MIDALSPAAPTASPMTPVPYRIRDKVAENAESATLTLEPLAARLDTPAPGQFVMLYAFGVGEIPMSYSGDPDGDAAAGTLTHTIRCVGAVSAALHDAGVGDVVGVRGPFGTSWDLAAAAGRDLVIVAGGCGLAPLRPVVLKALAERERYGNIVLVVGERTPGHFLFGPELDVWAADPALRVVRTVDRPDPGWSGDVGVVTEPVRHLSLRPDRTTAYLCGPEPMIRFSAAALIDNGMTAEDIQVSLERNMQCGIGLCGHCQLGPLLLCRDGPVVDYRVAGELLGIGEL
ncbi:MAG: FAD/NAD(P)-binding protein [Mycobacterium sp.]